MGYYEAPPGLTIQEIARRWIIDGDKMYDSSMPYWVDTAEAWQYRDYSWTRETACPGFGERYNANAEPKHYDKGSDKWDALKASLSQGWDNDDPIIITIGREDRRAKIGEGNHRLAVWRELGKPQVPVRFIFWNNCFRTDPKARVPTPIRFKEWLEKG